MGNIVPRETYAEEGADTGGMGGWGVGRYRLPQLGQRRRRPGLKPRDFSQIDFRPRGPIPPALPGRVGVARTGAARRVARGVGSGSEPVGSNRFVELVDPSATQRATLPTLSTLNPNAHPA